VIILYFYCNLFPQNKFDKYTMRAIKQILAGIFAGFFFLMLGLIGYFYFNQEKIVEILIKEVNKQVNTPIDVQEVSMSFFERFPYVSVKFDQVTIHGANKTDTKSNDTLLTAQSLFFDLDLKTLISDKPQINRLAISNGKIHITIANDGTTNYNILKSAPSENTGKQGKLAIDAIEIEQIQVIYEDRQKGAFYVNQISEALIQGVIQKEYWQLNTDITLTQTNIIPEAYNFFEAYRFSGQIFKSQELIDWKGTLEGDNKQLKLDGVFNLKNNQAVIQSPGMKLNAEFINKILAKNKLGKLKISDGVTKISQLRYTYKNKNNQYLSFGFDASHKTLLKQKNINITAQGRFNYRSGRPLIKINTAEAAYKGSSVYFEGNYNLPDQIIKGFTSFTANLKDLNDFQISDLPVKNLTGLIDGQAQVNANLIGGQAYSNMFKEGELGFQNVGLVIRENNFQINNLNAVLKASPKNINIEELTGNFNQNNLSFKGQIDNLFEYLQKKQPININGHAHTTNFNLSTFLLLSENSKNSEPFRLTDNIRLDLTFEAKNLSRDKFRAKHVKTHFRKYGRRIEVLNLQMQTSDGSISTNGKLLQQKNNEWYVELTGNLQNVNVTGIFSEFNNFGQEYITSKNLAGKLTADVKADFVFYPDFSIRPESLYLITDLKIEDGALIDYKTLEALSNYIDVEELQHVKFARFENQISIQNQKITIPYMEVQSSAIDLVLTGTHTFNNEIDYQISVGLTDVLFRKLRRKHQKASAKQQNNKMMVFVDITGTTEDYNIEFSKLKRKRVEPVPEKQQKKKFDIEFGDFK